MSKVENIRLTGENWDMAEDGGPEVGDIVRGTKTHREDDGLHSGWRFEDNDGLVWWAALDPGSVWSAEVVETESPVRITVERLTDMLVGTEDGEYEGTIWEADYLDVQNGKIEIGGYVNHIDVAELARLINKQGAL